MNFYDYEIGLELTDTKEFYFDILFCAFFRTPIIKQASYAILKLNLTPQLVLQIQNDMNNNIHTKFNLIIYLVDRNDKYKRIKQVFYKNFLALNINLKEKFLINKDRITCEILLINPVLHYMSNTNTFNTILENKTGYEAMQEYETFIKKTYGNTFHINHIGPNVNRNNHKYEQLLIKINNDLNVPTQIINMFKPFHSFNYYFYDDFHISDKCDKDISCTYFNLFDKNQLEQFDVSEQGDILQNISFIKESKFNDDHFKLDKTSESINFNHQEINFKTDKKQQSSVPKQDTIKSDNVNIVYNEDSSPDRNIMYTNSQALNQQAKNTLGQSSQSTNIYSPDTVDNSKKRYTISKDLFKTVFKNIITMECNNSFFEWLQFGKLYNFEINDTNAFLYTPMNIINIFQRKIKKEHYLSHLMKFNCLKYKDPEVDDN